MGAMLRRALRATAVLVMVGSVLVGTARADTVTDGAFDGRSQYGSLWWLGELTGAHEVWRTGHTGRGIDVAIIDSGVVPVPGLDGAGKVLHGPDYSLEAGVEPLRHLDSFGHGTHLAGIIAARDPRGVDPADPTRIQGLAPDARLVSVKVAEQRGATDITSVLAAIDWVIANRNRNGLNIRVLNLSFATDSTLGYLEDPLSYAVEKAWRAGIVVVVAAGNGGNDTAALPQPAANPFVISVGALETQDNANPRDDTVSTYSSRGSLTRPPDLVAPGSRIVSLRDPGSYLDEQYPGARVGEQLFRGSGTSQAAAVVSALAALVVETHPTYGPDQVKDLLESSADPLYGASVRLQGSGAADGDDAAARRLLFPTLSRQTYAPATGTGTLDAARGTLQVLDEGQAAGEGLLGSTVDLLLGTVTSLVGLLLGPAPTPPPTWTTSSEALAGSWVDGTWVSEPWSGNRWATEDWAGNRWAGNRWAGDGWVGNRWAGGDWSSQRWTTSAWG
jgi:serine protease AprX